MAAESEVDRRRQHVGLALVLSLEFSACVQFAVIVTVRVEGEGEDEG